MLVFIWYVSHKNFGKSSWGLILKNTIGSIKVMSKKLVYAYA